MQVQKKKFVESNKLIVVLIVAVLAMSGALAYQQYSLSKTDPTSYLHYLSNSLDNMNVALKVTCTSPQGLPCGSRYLSHDLITDNFENWTSAFFSSTAQDVFVPFSITDSTSAKDTEYAWGPIIVGSSECQSIYCYGTSSGAGTGGRIAIGTSNTAPARTDYKLNAQYLANSIVTSTTWNGASENITIGASVTANNSTTIQEVGYFVQWSKFTVNTASAQALFLFFHDNGIGLSVNNGDVVSVLYTLILPTGFTNSFGNILTLIFANSNSNPTFAPASTITKISSATYGASTFAIYSQQTIAVAGTLGEDTSQTNTFPNFQIAVGTTNTAFAVTQYALAAVISGTYTQGTSTLSLSTNTLSLASTITGLTGQNVVEWGMFMAFNCGATQTLYVMIYRNVIGGTVANPGITVDINLGF